MLIGILMVVIVDYGMGNLKSIQNMFFKLGVTAEITNDIKKIKNADRLILPGVGSFDYGMSMIKESGLLNSIDTVVNDRGRPLLGICLGAQMLGKSSEEGSSEGLGWINMKAKKLRSCRINRVPNMGWRNIDIKKNVPIVENISADDRFYFVHSYYLECEVLSDVIATSNHVDEFAAVVGRGNVIGIQFHPEKSLKFGMQIFKSFLSL